MIQLKKVVSFEKRFNLNNDYIKTLVSPIDAYWQDVVIGNSQCYEVIFEGKVAGHFFVNSQKTLVQFYIFKEYFIYASDIFKFVITNDMIKSAAVSTKEPEFLALCLDYQKRVSVDSYLFIDNKNIIYELDDFKDISFRLAKKTDIDIIKNKCGLPYEGYYKNLIENDQLFVLYDSVTFLGIGEFRVSKTHSQYGDIGMLVVEEYRRKGIGTYIITQLKEHCYRNNLKPIASCNSVNIASKKTLEKSGFISKHRIIRVYFD